MKKFYSMVAVFTAALVLSCSGGGDSSGTPEPGDGSVTGVTLNITASGLVIGNTLTLTATVLPADATDKSVTWESDNESAATVADGVVTGIAEGPATITVTTVDGNHTATCDITVTATAVPFSPTVDGVKDAGYTTAASPANDGGGNSWGTTLGKLSYHSDGTDLYIHFNFVSVGSGNNVYLFIDDESMATGSNPSAADCTGWGALSVGDNIFTNSNGFNCDFSAVGWRFDGSVGQTPAGKFNMGNVSKLISGIRTDVSGAVTHAVSADHSGYEFKIPYTAIGSGAISGQTVRAIVLFGKNGNTDVAGDASWGGIRSTIPALTGTAANSYLTDINKAVTLVLE